MLKKTNQKGFTIIEVLIVLAIAGLIMVVVFLAVPALQRNSRNSSHRSEANRFASAVGEVTTNKGGGTLTASSYDSALGVTAGSDANKVFDLSNVKDVTKLTIEAQGAATGPTVTTYVLRTGAKCSAADSSTTNAGTSSRSAALLFAVEDKTGAAVVQCQDV